MNAHHANVLGRLLAYTSFVSSAVFCFALRGGKYGWMQEVDPTIPDGAVADDSGNRVLFIVVLPAVMTIPQLAIGVAIALQSLQRAPAWLRDGTRLPRMRNFP